MLDGRHAEGILRIRHAIANAGETAQSPGQHALLMRLLVAAHDAAGDPIAGLAAIDDALALPGSRVWEAEHRRLRARCLSSLGAAPDEVDAELARAVEVARRQGAVEIERRIQADRSRDSGRS